MDGFAGWFAELLWLAGRWLLVSGFVVLFACWRAGQQVCCFASCGFAGLFAGLLVGWSLVCWLAVLLVCQSVDCLVSRFVGQLLSWFVCLLAHWSNGFLARWLAGLLVGMFVGLPATGLLVCRLACHWFAGLLVCMFVGQLVGWFVGLLVC